MSREAGPSSNSRRNHDSRRHRHHRNHVPDRMNAQFSSVHPTYSPASHIYYPWLCPTIYPAPIYGPWHQFPSAYGDLGEPPAAYAASTLAAGHGTSHSTTATTSSWWNQSESSITSFNGGAMAWIQPVATSYMHGGNVGFSGLPQMLLFIYVPFISDQHHNPNPAQPPNPRGRNRGHDDATHCPQLPAPTNNTVQASRDANSHLGTWERERTLSNGSTQVYTNAVPASGMVGKAPDNTGSSTSAAQQPQGLDPVHETTPRHNLDWAATVTFDDGIVIFDFLDREEAVDSTDSEMRINGAFGQSIVNDIAAMMRPDARLTDETITRQLKTRTSEQPSTSENNQEAASCVICLDGYKDQHMIGRLECGHEYHSDCIRKWLRVKNECPICKSQALPLTQECPVRPEVV